jgi:diguanylate cyclase (GGDEF)-like protein
MTALHRQTTSSARASRPVARQSRRELERQLRDALTALHQLQSLAYTDPLTGLANRRAFDARLDEELSRSSRSEAPFTVLAIDVNGFKAVNDTLGHAAGDALLCRLAELLKATLRGHDVIARAGGDEFLVILPAANRLHAAAAASRLFLAMAALKLDGPPVSLAIGAATYGVDGDTAHGLVAHADLEMYADKRRRKLHAGG